ncbi:MAG: aconitase family protein [Amaricoccus sp.]|uniref:cis-3-hydroxy-L-proline dehydratase n=1 Tax=Amaricoccus sp. TaxID=1872485 RepID=UPI0039E48AAC
MTAALRILPGTAAGPILATPEPLSFWGGVDPATARVMDVHHPLHGATIAGSILMMPTTRGSCTGSGVLLDLALTGRAPAALVFEEAEDVVTLGAMIAAELYGCRVPVLRLAPDAFTALARAEAAEIGPDAIRAGGFTLPIAEVDPAALALSDDDRAMLDGRDGPAVALAMRVIAAMARLQGAEGLTDVTRGHIDGCIYASPANLTFAETLAGMGARVRLPTTMNAISVDRARWQEQGVPPDFGGPAARLADAYVRMGCRPTFTCAPYLLDAPPVEGEAIAWAESNAVVYANSVLGARTAKHPDFLDLFIAMTGRAPLSGVYLDEGRRARRVIDVELPEGADDAFWPLVGYLAGLASPDRIPLLRGLAGGRPRPDDLKAFCAAFGSTSAAPMLHIEGVTPEAAGAGEADRTAITAVDLARGWQALAAGPEEVDLVAVGSPHASLTECRALAAALAAALDGGPRAPEVAVIVTAGRDTIAAAEAEGTLARLAAAGVQVLPDLCWCSIRAPLLPERTRAILTNSGKYAHYGPGLSGRPVRLGSLADCAAAARTGRAPRGLPQWLTSRSPT